MAEVIIITYQKHNRYIQPTDMKRRAHPRSNLFFVYLTANVSKSCDSILMRFEIYSKVLIERSVAESRCVVVGNTDFHPFD